MPIAARQVAQAMEARPLGRCGRFMSAGLVDAEGQERDRDGSRNDRNPQHRAHVASPQPQKQHRQEGPGKGTNGVQRLAQSVGRVAQGRGRYVGDDGIARCAANALADAVDEPCRHHTPKAVSASGNTGLVSAARP